MRVSAAGARQSGLRAAWAVPGGQLAAKTRPPGRVPGAAVRLLGARASAPVGNRGVSAPLGRTVGPVAPDPAAKTGNSRRAGGCGPCPWTTYGNMATWHRGNMASWHRLVSGGAAQAGMGNQLSTPTEK